MIGRRTLIGAGLALAATRAGAAVPDSKPRAIDALVLPAGFGGVIGYGRGGRLVHLRCAGMADVEAGRPVTPATRFRWGSASKWLASAAVLRLVDMGRLALDAPVSRYLPDFRADTGAQVRLVHLLSNTSGIPDLLSREVASNPGLRSSNASAAAMVARFADGDLAFAPGSGWDYAALNWVIIAAMVERVTGQPFADALERLAIRPIGLPDTGFAQAGAPEMPALAAAYATTAPVARKMSPAPAFIAATGNVASTAADAVRAAHGIFNGRLLRPASRVALATVRWPAEAYALGGRVRDIAGARWAWEAGRVGGYRALIAHRLGSDETVVAFNNTDVAQSTIGGWVETIARA
ncbi:D-alanyl-D-alanine carboxypeptidase [Sphingomonas guangdongensis]|uniref:D-alanyl-D-alanine carboxypeptidase n=1 Tax=Sphingomonas guangdongensis TaxID=1141890 RepID=A0A285QAI2_9SPHN|nr:serine hydrolase domain-containing protein [Sphingomonas guangdongensis]SOB78955.1 D-alanyl-D-alanine carboxypeptidase [Sphingomonas guangdongensis]